MIKRDGGFGMRKAVDLTPQEYEGDRSGLRLVATPQGLEVTGWYDSIVGIPGFVVSWEAIDQARKKLTKRVEPRKG